MASLSLFSFNPKENPLCLDRSSPEFQNWSKQNSLHRAIHFGKNGLNFVSHAITGKVSGICSFVRHFPEHIYPAVKPTLHTYCPLVAVVTDTAMASIIGMVTFSDHLENVNEAQWALNGGLVKDAKNKHWGSIAANVALVAGNSIFSYLALKEIIHYGVKRMGDFAAGIGSHRYFGVLPKAWGTISDLTTRVTPKAHAWISRVRPCGIPLATVAGVCFAGAFLGLAVQAQIDSNRYKGNEEIRKIKISKKTGKEKNYAALSKQALRERDQYLVKLGLTAMGLLCCGTIPLAIGGTLALLAVGRVQYHRQ